MKTKGYLLDTNICISMLKNKYGVREAILKAKAENCYVSEITLGELYFGASFSNNKKERLKDVAFIVDRFKVISVSGTLPLFGDIKANLKRKGTLIDDFDILIGCAAIHKDCLEFSSKTGQLDRMHKYKPCPAGISRIDS